MIFPLKNLDFSRISQLALLDYRRVIIPSHSVGCLAIRQSSHWQGLPGPKIKSFCTFYGHYSHYSHYGHYSHSMVTVVTIVTISSQPFEIMWPNLSQALFDKCDDIPLQSLVSRGLRSDRSTSSFPSPARIPMSRLIKSSPCGKIILELWGINFNSHHYVI